MLALLDHVRAALQTPAPDNIPEVVGTLVVIILSWLLGRKKIKSQ